ncbi:9364_t:CDS:2, partial [Scutellospora calospora]
MSEEAEQTELQTLQPDDWIEEEFGKNKKNKGSEIKAEKPEEKKAPSKKKPPIAVIRAQLEAARAAEEERIRQEQEEQRRIEEERKRIEEEEKQKELAKQRRKEKEKEKKERLRQEGKLLSKSQKAKKQQDQLRLQQMIESGYKIEGFDNGEQKPKKVVYASKKKKGPPKQTSDKTEAEVVAVKVDNTPEISENLEAEKEIETNKNVKDSWEEDEELGNSKHTEITDGVKDQWDVTSDEMEDINEQSDSTSDEKETSKNVISAETLPETSSATPIKVGTDKNQKPEKVVDTGITQKNVSVKETTKTSESVNESEESETDDSSEDRDEGSDNEKITEHQKQAMKQKADAAERRKKRHEEALAARSKDDLRSPICSLRHFRDDILDEQGTPILMYDGHIKPVETIKEGDQVMGDDSTPRNVSGVTSGEGILYKIIPRNYPFAQPFICNDAHILVLKMMLGPSLQHHCNEDGKTLFKLVYFIHDRTTNLIQKTVKLYPYPSAEYSTMNNAKRAVIRDFELVDKNKIYNLDSSSSINSIVRPGFVWQPTVTQFLNSDSEVQSHAKMFTPEKVRFPSQEGAFAKIVKRFINIQTFPAVIELCAWLIGFWIGSNIANQHSKD